MIRSYKTVIPITCEAIPWKFLRPGDIVIVTYVEERVHPGHERQDIFVGVICKHGFRELPFHPDFDPRACFKKTPE